MAKKKKRGVNPLHLSILIFVVVVLGICLFLFLDAVTLDTGILSEYVESGGFTGMEVVFGYSKSVTVLITVTMTILAFSFVALIPLILGVLGVILNITTSRLICLIGIVALVVGAIMFYYIPNYMVFGSDFAELIGDSLTFVTGIGSYLGLACYGVAALIALFRVFKLK